MRLATVKSPPIIAHRDTKNDDQDLELMYRKKEVKGFQRNAIVIPCCILRTRLITAVWRGSGDVIEELLRKGAANLTVAAKNGQNFSTTGTSSDLGYKEKVIILLFFATVISCIGR